MVLVQKCPFFQLFFLGKIGQENIFYDILQRNNAFPGYKNKKFKKSKNWHFSKGVNPCFWSKNDHYSNFFGMGGGAKIGKKNIFHDILERKHAFLGYKNKPIVLVQKWPFFQLFFFRQNMPGKCVSWYSRTKKRFSRL